MAPIRIRSWMFQQNNSPAIFGGPSYCDEYQTVYDSFTTKPSSAVATLQNAMVSSLVDGGVWTKVDVFYMFAQESNSDSEALKNWITPGTYDATLYNDSTADPTFSTLQGFVGGNANNINTNWIPSTNGVNYKKDDCSFGVHVRNNLAESTIPIGVGDSGNGTQAVLYPRTSADYTYIRVNNQAVATFSGVTDSRGFWIAQRTASNAMAVYRDASLIGSSTNASIALPAYKIYVLANDSNGALTPANVSNYEVSCAFAGASFTSGERTALTNAINTYLDSVAFFFSVTQSGPMEQVDVIFKSDPDSNIYIDWGDGTINKLSSSGHDNSITSTYSSEGTYDVKLYGDLDKLKKIDISDQTVISDFNIGNFQPTGLNFLKVDNVSGVSGSLLNLPSTITYLYLDDVGALITGDVEHLEDTVMYIRLVELDLIDVDISKLGSDILYVYLDGNYGGMDLSGSVAGLSSTLISLELLRCTSAMSGAYPTLANLRRADFLNVKGTTTLNTNIFTNAEPIYISLGGFGAGLVTGSLSDLANVSSYVAISATEGISGNIEDLATILNTFYVNNAGTDMTYGGGAVPAFAATTITFHVGMLTATLDSFLNAWASTAGSGTKTISLAGTNEARSAASDAAVTTLNGLGKTITTN